MKSLSGRQSSPHFGGGISAFVQPRCAGALKGRGGLAKLVEQRFFLLLSAHFIDRRKIDQQARARSTWQENDDERPSLALDETGDIATTKLVSSSRATTPRFGSRVVNG